MNSKCRNNIIRDLGKLMERVEYRISMERLPKAESYLQGGLEILADFDISCGGETHEYLAVFYRANMQGTNCKQGSLIVPHLKMLDTGIINSRNESFMFIGNVEVMNSPEHYIPSFVWLQRANYLDDIFTGSVYMSLFNNTLKAIKVLPKWEIDIFGFPTVDGNKIDCKEVESGSKVVNYISNNGWQMAWDFLPNSESPELIRGIRVLLDNDTIRFGFDISSDVSIKLTDVSVGPRNF